MSVQTSSPTPDSIKVDEAAIEQFKKSLREKLIGSGDPEYDDARTIFNAMIDKHPRLIARCANVADVIAAVNFGHDNNLETTIRSAVHRVGEDETAWNKRDANWSMVIVGVDPDPANNDTTYERLQNVKAKYDLDNFFHVNQNIKPK